MSREGKRKVTQTDAERVTAGLTAYVQAGTFAKAAAETKIAESTLREWAASAKWADVLAEIRLAHAREIRTRFAAGAAEFAEGLELAQRVAVDHLKRLDGYARNGNVIEGQEVATLLRAVAAGAETVSRLGEVATPESMGAARPTAWLVREERPADTD